MKNFKITLSIIVLLISFTCKAQTSLKVKEKYNTEIIGTWESNDELGHKLEFLTNGRLKIYSNNELIDTINYAVVISCNGNTISNGNMFLKFEDEDGDVGCDIINAINNENSNILSITTEQGKLETYTKVN